MKKFALITGASGGIGSAAAKKLASEGWNLYLHYFRGEHVIHQLLEELQQYQVEVIPLQADLLTDRGVSDLYESIFQLHAIVYSAGSAPYGMFEDLDDETLDNMIQLHVKSPLKIIKHLLPKLRRNSPSDIILLSSIWGQTGAACEVIYSTVKGAQISFVKALSKEVAQSGIKVNCIAPGAIKTDMLRHFTPSDLESLENEIPMGRLGKPDEIANAISFLLSQKSTYITGQVLAVNGGWYT